MKHTDDTTAYPELHGAESSGFAPAYPICVSQHLWTMKGEEENMQDNLLHPGCTAEGSTAQVIVHFCLLPNSFLIFFVSSLFLPFYLSQRTSSPMLEYRVYLDNQHNMADRHVNRTVSTSVPPVRDGSCLSVPIPGSVTTTATTVSSRVSSFMTDTCGPTGSVCDVISSAWNTFSSTSRSLHHSDQDPVSAAAHLHLLGESLSLIGLHLQETNKMVCMSSGFSLLLDSLLCALAPLICLTAQIPELKSCTQHTLGSTLENIAYVMPGL
ncbi:uncharacterized protein LOC111584783 isoform X3 [Amphiprion ocellaris]|nr:uncharacterized protein LOC111584783 isoform X3 [Amphiprion ocellaris]